VIHLRIVAPAFCSSRVLDLLTAAESVTNVVRLPAAALKPPGDLILCDVAREEASVIVDDLRELGVPLEGSIALTPIDSQISARADAVVKAAAGAPADAVVWEEVEARTSDSIELSASFLLFTVVAMLIAAVGILLDSPILIVGAMVVGPEFGPLAGVCVAIVERRPGLARRSLTALGIAFPIGIAATYFGVELLIFAGQAPADFSTTQHPLTDFISRPGLFSFLVAALAGTAGVMSLTSAKSGALIGVLISVTTIPAAANIGVAAAFGDWSQVGGAALQLTINFGAILLAGVLTLSVQRALFLRRERRHRHGAARKAAGLDEEDSAG